MSNLYKFSRVKCDENVKKVVDCNDIISEKIIKIRESVNNAVNQPNDGFTVGIDAKHVEDLLEDGEEYENLTEDDIDNADNEQIIQSAHESANLIIENAHTEAEQIISEAKERADNFIHEGMNQAKKIMDQAKKEGYDTGYEEGSQKGINEINAMKAELEKKSESLDKAYDERVKRMEPELVDVLLRIFSEVTQVLSVEKKDLIVTLVNSVMSGTEVSKNYIIKTNKDDAHFLRDNKDRIQGAVGRDINIEIVEDPTMKRNQCLIDTDLGIFDCSLDIQLENLISNIKILACSGVDYFN